MVRTSYCYITSGSLSQFYMAGHCTGAVKKEDNY